MILYTVAFPTGSVVRFNSPGFFPLSTHTYQAHSEGMGCLTFTREAGFDVIPLAQYHILAWICNFENQNDFRRSASTLAGSFEQQCRRISQFMALQELKKAGYYRSSWH